ncbi:MULTISPECIES: hypothetical protein [Actinomycetes]|uniref:Uncharacterized protein n=2 Tax=Actinomycetes TaxID=1760 RepID=A0ABP6M0K9_9MICC
MTGDVIQDAPSPALPTDVLRQALADSLLGNAAALRSRLTPVAGLNVVFPVQWSVQRQEALTELVDDVLPSDQPGVGHDMEDRLFLAVLAAGAAGSSTMVVQVVGQVDRTDVSCHALDAPAAREALREALGRIEAVLR